LAEAEVSNETKLDISEAKENNDTISEEVISENVKSDKIPLETENSESDENSSSINNIPTEHTDKEPVIEHEVLDIEDTLTEEIEAQMPKYDDAFFAEILTELAVQFSSNGKKLLSTVIAQSKATLVLDKLTLFVPNGFKNDSLDAEGVELKRFFYKKIPDREFELDIVEIKVEFKSVIPHTFQDRVDAIVKENPEMIKWFENLDLKSN